jgi:large subunit ribosomal protein L4
MNKKERRKALFCALSSKLKNNQLIVVDNIMFDEIKTKNMINVLSSFSCEKNILVATPNKNEMLDRSISNIPFAKSVLVNYLNIKDLLKYKTLILLKESLVSLDSLV